MLGKGGGAVARGGELAVATQLTARHGANFKFMWESTELVKTIGYGMHAGQEKAQERAKETRRDTINAEAPRHLHLIQQHISILYRVPWF
jgi:hypothetical protein